MRIQVRTKRSRIPNTGLSSDLNPVELCANPEEAEAEIHEYAFFETYVWVCVCGDSQGGDWAHHQLDPHPSGGGSAGTTSPPSPYLSYFHASCFLRSEISISETGNDLEHFLNKNSSLSNFFDRIIKKDLIFPLSFPQGIIYFLFRDCCMSSNLICLYNLLLYRTSPHVTRILICNYSIQQTPVFT